MDGNTCCIYFCTGLSMFGVVCLVRCAHQLPPPLTTTLFTLSHPLPLLRRSLANNWFDRDSPFADESFPWPT